MRSQSTKAGFVALALLLASGLYWHQAQAPLALLPPEPTPVTMLFVGDLMLDRGVARRAALGGGASLVEGMRPLVARNDIIVLNLEGTITGNPSIAERDNTILRFTFDPALAKEVLQALGADVVSLANNHALDFGASGYAETTTNLDRFGVKYFGHPLNSKNISTMLEVGGIMFCFVGYHELYDDDTTSVLAEIARLRPLCGATVVMSHWGLEYEPLQTAGQVAEAHAFIDAGADLVVGAHPHVVQPAEVYKGKAIFYSLGNFVFDQDFSWGTTHGLALEAQFSAGKTTVTLVPLAIVESRPAPALGEVAQRIIEAAGGLDSILLP